MKRMVAIAVATAASVALATALPNKAAAGEVKQLTARVANRPPIQVPSEQRFVVCDVCPEATTLTAMRPAAVVGQADAEKVSAGTAKAYAKAEPAAPSGDKSQFNLYFDFDKSSLKGGEQAKMRSHSQELRDANAIEVKGYTDSTGSKDYNDSLASRRTDAVVAAIRELGVERSITKSSEGKCCYISSHPTLNRRVEVKFNRFGGN